MGLCCKCNSTWMTATDALREDMRKGFYKKPPREVPLNKILQNPTHAFIMDAKFDSTNVFEKWSRNNN